jgi:hypothetical protein
MSMLPGLCWGWGFDGHRKLASMMQDPLRQDLCLRQWFAARQSSTLQNQACDPDRWRVSTHPNYDPLEANRHFLEVDWVNPPSDYPREYAAVEARVGVVNAKRNGLVPWRVEELTAQLVADFSSRDEARILATAFILSHYVTDSFSVLHDTKNFDPNDGLHSRWESAMLNTNAHLNGIAALATSYLGSPGFVDPRQDLFDTIVVGNALVSELIAADTDAGGNVDILYTATADLTGRRWGDALTAMSSILWTAWAQAGAPELAGFSATCSRAVPSEVLEFQGYPPVPGWRGDAGPRRDAGHGVDAGADGGKALDAGAAGDGGAQPDGGFHPDAGAAQNGGGAAVDAGSSTDAGGGADSGEGAGADGGASSSLGGGGVRLPGGADESAGCGCGAGGSVVGFTLLICGPALSFVRRRTKAKRSKRAE